MWKLTGIPLLFYFILPRLIIYICTYDICIYCIILRNLVGKTKLVGSNGPIAANNLQRQAYPSQGQAALTPVKSFPTVIWFSGVQHYCWVKPLKLGTYWERKTDQRFCYNIGRPTAAAWQASRYQLFVIDSPLV
jgi:hypothetical protein